MAGGEVTSQLVSQRAQSASSVSCAVLPGIDPRQVKSNLFFSSSLFSNSWGLYLGTGGFEGGREDYSIRALGLINSSDDTVRRRS
jgi:hypothetical protein